jgi:hypothetical protein
VVEVIDLANVAVYGVFDPYALSSSCSSLAMVVVLASAFVHFSIKVEGIIKMELVSSQKIDDSPFECRCSYQPVPVLASEAMNALTKRTC